MNAATKWELVPADEMPVVRTYPRTLAEAFPGTSQTISDPLERYPRISRVPMHEKVLYVIAVLAAVLVWVTR